MEFCATQRPDPTGNVYTVAPLDGDGPIKTFQRRDLLDGRCLVSDQLRETSPVEDIRDDEDTHSGNSDDDELYKVMTIMPHHPDLDHESIAKYTTNCRNSFRLRQTTLFSQMQNLIQVS